MQEAAQKKLEEADRRFQQELERERRAREEAETKAREEAKMRELDEAYAEKMATERLKSFEQRTKSNLKAKEEWLGRLKLGQQATPAELVCGGGGQCANDSR